MMHHTSGIMDFYELLKLAGWVYGDAVSEHDALWARTRMPRLNVAPGTRESYSDGNYVLLGLVVERVSGQPLGAYLQSTIFGPLGMTHTVLTGDHTVVVPHEARPYAVLDGPPRLMANRFNSSIGLSATGEPSGTTVSFNPSKIAAPGGGTSTMTIKVGSSTAVGTVGLSPTRSVFRAPG